MSDVIFIIEGHDRIEWRPYYDKRRPYHFMTDCYRDIGRLRDMYWARGEIPPPLRVKTLYAVISDAQLKAMGIKRDVF